MGRQPCCDKSGLKRGPWTIEEDHKLMNFILTNGIQCWRMVPKLAGLQRCGKSCRLRWINYLRPDLKRGGFTEMEDNQIIQLHSRIGNRWSKIAAHFPGRTDNEIKNHWNTRIKKRLRLLGLYPVTHLPIQVPEPNSLKDEDVLEAKAMNSQADEANQNYHTETNAKTEDKDEFKVMDDPSNRLKNYAAVCDNNYKLDPWINQENSTNVTDSYTSSMSMEESNMNSCIGESNCMQQWVHSVDSILSWDCFINPLDDAVFVPGRYYM